MDGFPATQHALKEWAAVIEALAAGAQGVLLRKGGLFEGAGDFAVEQPAFWLYPTTYHLDAVAVRPEHRRFAEQASLAQPPAGEIAVRYGARVMAVHRAPSLAAVQELLPHHIWSAEYASERFHMRPNMPLLVLVTQIWSLPQPARLPLCPAYGGCTSWIKLESALDGASATPCQTEDDVRERARLVSQALGAPLPMA